jgi:hypothetical protein
MELIRKLKQSLTQVDSGRKIVAQRPIVKNITISVKFLDACYQNFGRAEEREGAFLKVTQPKMLEDILHPTCGWVR